MKGSRTIRDSLGTMTSSAPMRAPAITLAFCCLVQAAFSATDPAQAGTPAVPAAQKPARPTLEAGMTAEQIVQIVGKPNRVKKLKQDAIEAEVWYYSFDRPYGVRQIAAQMREVPYVDPITGVMKMMQEPVYSEERSYLVETTELLIINGALAQSKRYRQVKRDILN